MAEIQRVQLHKTPELLNALKVDVLVVLAEGGDFTDWQNEGVRCLDWALNHQLRRARKKLFEIPVFVPSMGKIKASYVVLCPSRFNMETLVKNILTMGLTSLAFVSEDGNVPNVNHQWDHSRFSSIFLCEGLAGSRGGDS